jgi:glycerol kinase
VQNLVEKSGIDTAQIAAVGISNQRETTAIWDRKTGKPLAPAVVWQCDRARGIVDEVEKAGYGGICKKNYRNSAFRLFSCSKDGMASAGLPGKGSGSGIG